ncbi:hypothetical protein BC826DRAFT_1044539 [Russula brevipes]|nr:hypothetical protein BC826DRAFT_1044539 [Russula brevipes]
MIVLFPGENWYTFPLAILGKLYSNTLLVWLNNRISIRERVIARGVANRPQALTLALAPRSDFATDTTTIEIGQPSPVPKLPGSGDLETI